MLFRINTVRSAGRVGYTTDGTGLAKIDPDGRAGTEKSNFFFFFFYQSICNDHCIDFRDIRGGHAKIKLR